MPKLGRRRKFWGPLVCVYVCVLEDLYQIKTLHKQSDKNKFSPWGRQRGWRQPPGASGWVWKEHVDREELWLLLVWQEKGLKQVRIRLVAFWVEMQKGCGREILKMPALSTLSMLVLLMLWQLCTEVKEKVPCLLALEFLSFASFFFSFSQSLKSYLALQVFRRRSWTSQGRAAEVMRKRTDQKEKKKGA